MCWKSRGSFARLDAIQFFGFGFNLICLMASILLRRPGLAGSCLPAPLFNAGLNCWQYRLLSMFGSRVLQWLLGGGQTRPQPQNVGRDEA